MNDRALSDLLIGLDAELDHRARATQIAQAILREVEQLVPGSLQQATSAVLLDSLRGSLA